MSLAPRRVAPTTPFVAQLLAPLLVVLLAACSGDDPKQQRTVQLFQAAAPRPDEAPTILNTELPFRYPVALYARRAQGNVTLRLYVDRDGLVIRDSTRVEERSGKPELDSAALKGAAELRFVPAKLRGEPMATAVLFPVYFRHPEAAPLPGDTILPRNGPASPAAPPPDDR